MYFLSSTRFNGDKKYFSGADLPQTISKALNFLVREEPSPLQDSHLSENRIGFRRFVCCYKIAGASAVQIAAQSQHSHPLHELSALELVDLVEIEVGNFDGIFYVRGEFIGALFYGEAAVLEVFRDGRRADFGLVRLPFEDEGGF